MALQPTVSQPPYELLAVTADPAEGEAFTEAGSTLVEAVPMPRDVAGVVGQFIVKHHVERAFVKRQRKPIEATLAKPQLDDGGPEVGQ